jgi:hypothetical protein
MRKALLVRLRTAKRDSGIGGVSDSAGGAPGNPEGSVMEIEGIRGPEAFLLGISTVGRLGFEGDIDGGPSKSGVFSPEGGLPR